MSVEAIQFADFDRISKENLVDLVPNRPYFEYTDLHEATKALCSGDFHNFREYMETRYRMQKSEEFWGDLQEKFWDIRKEYGPIVQVDEI